MNTLAHPYSGVGQKPFIYYEVQVKLKNKGQGLGGGLTVIGFLAFSILLIAGTIIFSEFDQQDI